MNMLSYSVKVLHFNESTAGLYITLYYKKTHFSRYDLKDGAASVVITAAQTEMI